MKLKKITLILTSICLTTKIYALGMPVFDALVNYTAGMQLTEAITTTAKVSEQVANSYQLVDSAQRNLKKFTDWSNLTDFRGMVDKVAQAGNIGHSLGKASGGILEGLNTMTGDSYGSLGVLQDTLQSAAAVMDEHANDMYKQASGLDSINSGIKNGSDGVVSVLQGNAQLMQGIAAQNEHLNQNVEAMNKMNMAKMQSDLTKDKEQEDYSWNKAKAAAQGLDDGYQEDGSFDISKTAKFKYM